MTRPDDFKKLRPLKKVTNQLHSSRWKSKTSHKVQLECGHTQWVNGHRETGLAPEKARCDECGKAFAAAKKEQKA